MTITENGLARVRKNGHWLADDIMAYLLCHAEFDHIKNKVDPGKKYGIIVMYPAVLETFPKTCKSSHVLKNHKMANIIGLPGWKDMGGQQCPALKFNKRICFYNNDCFVDQSGTTEGAHWSYIMIEVVTIACDLNLKIVNYRWDSSKNQINKRVDQFSAH